MLLLLLRRTSLDTESLRFLSRFVTTSLVDHICCASLKNMRKKTSSKILNRSSKGFAEE